VNEREIGVASVAAPIRDRHGDVVAAISVGGPVTRLDSSSKRQYATAIVAAGEDVSRRLGWTAPVLEREA
jgi:DNA-binding IclR family transcriptional regulator